MIVPEITPAALKEALDRGDNLYLLDVRRPNEAAFASLPNSTLVTLQTMPARLGEIKPPAGARVVVYCHHGVRSQHGAGFLIANGFADVVSLAGGIDAWSLEIDPTVPRY